ncbi:MAG: TetR/AcrR family transcriptional regulator [Candidatus Glassbacteria bacterium]
MPKIVDREEKREAISEAAVTVFRELGYHETRMVDIARAAGIGKGTLYEYFENKSDILRFAFDRYFESFRAGAVRAMNSADGPADRLFVVISFALEHAAGWEDYCSVYLDYLTLEHSNRDVSLEHIYGTMRTLLIDLIRQGQDEGTIRRDLDPLATAELLLSVYDGMVMHRVFEEPRSDATSINSTALAVLVRGLGGELI